MRLTTILLLVSFMQVAASGFAQKITLNVSKSPLSKVFREIKSQSGYNFLYTDNLMKNTKPVTLRVRDEDIMVVLEKIFINQPISYSIESKTVLIKAPVAPKVKIAPLGKVITIDLKGKITDEVGRPLSGATLQIKGTATKTISNGEGEFSFSSVPEKSVITASYLGYVTQDIVISASGLITIVLKEDFAKLSDVVVIGYGTQKRSNLTGSVGQVKFKDIKDQPVTSFDEALVGKIAGLQVLQTTGEPGRQTTFKIRGTGSLTAGTDPLIVLDGIPLENQGQATELAAISDIESVEVLKDASSAAIYGSRGANGVIIITTKKGSKDGLKINYSNNIGWQKVSKKIDMLDAYQYAALSKAGHDNAYLDEVPGASITDADNIRPQGYQRTPPELYPYLQGQQGLTNTDWQDAIFKTAMLQNHNLTFSGGSGKSTYHISGNYTSKDGIVLNSDYKRYAARINVNVQDRKLNLGVNFSPSYSVENRINAYGPNSEEGVISSALQMSPTWPVYSPDGSYSYQGNGAWRIGTDYQHNEILNPVAIAELIKNKIYHVNLLGRAFLRYTPIEGLDIEGSIGGTVNNYMNNYYRPSTLPNLGSQFYDKASTPTARASSTFIYNWISEFNTTYSKSFGKHNLKATAVLSAQKNNSNMHSSTATNFPNDLVETLNGGQVTSADGEITEWSLLSALSRVQYDYDGKYLLSAAIRGDASSRFGKNNRWGYFPSISGGWRVSSEPFFNDLKLVSTLKLKASYGQTGNFQIGNYEAIPRIGPDNYILGSASGQQVSGLTSVGIANPNLTWEKMSMVNFGLDVGLFHDKLTLEVEWYNSNTSGLLLNVPVPTLTGFGSARQNIGKVNNKGVELTISGRSKITESLSWTGSANISANKNKVKALGPGNTPIIQTAGTANTYFITQVGDPIGSYYFMRTDGVFKNQQEIDGYPHFADSKPGDFRFVDVNADGKIDVNTDRTIVGNYFPDFTYSFSNNLSFKNFDLGVTFQGVQGVEIVNLMRRYITNMEGNFNNTIEALDRWQSPSNPGNGLINRANRKAKGNNGRTSDFHVEDGSYLRLQNVTIGYTLPKTFTKKIGFSSLRILLSGQNLAIFTGYKGYNPEVNIYDGNALTPGVDYGSYPLARTISFGLNASF